MLKKVKNFLTKYITTLKRKGEKFGSGDTKVLPNRDTATTKSPYNSLKCPYCRSQDIVKRGWRKKKESKSSCICAGTAKKFLLLISPKAGIIR